MNERKSLLKKKLQVFISSTFLDLKDERQAAVEAILDAGHIPAGMELFKAGNEDQLKTIKRWIDESDVYLLILGGRYGSLDTETGKSYTHLEYEYAVGKEMPVFAVVLSDPWLFNKAAIKGKENVFEQAEPKKYEQFKEFVHSKVIRPVDDLKDIKLSVHTTMNEFKELYQFSGWVKGSEVEDNSKIVAENRELLKENKKLKELVEKQSVQKKVGNFEFEELKRTLKHKKLTIPAGKFGNDKEISLSFLSVFKKFRDFLSVGIENKVGTDESQIYMYYNIAPTLMSFGLVEKVKLAGVKYERIQTSRDGLKFLGYIDIEEAKIQKETLRK